MINTLKEFKIIFIVGLLYILTAFFDSAIFQEALGNTLMFLKEMLEILPAVFILNGLINSWVPTEIVIKNFGRESGVKGKIASLLVGSVSAGPIYAAFPLAQSLLIKGASIGNTIIIISAWAVVKIPMLIVESKFLGISFAATRYLLTVPGIIILGIVCEKILSRSEINTVTRKNQQKEIEKIRELLPGYNCGSCGYDSCILYAKAILSRNEKTNRCKPGGEEVQLKLQKIMN
ncbi:MAG: permease [Atribacterota bacterium]|nr:permease [Atribacterota bacterium]MDD4895155.1 permease [Atribacterota bacterium]MDD5637196.1 permease [Atribacterota bacterium]